MGLLGHLVCALAHVAFAAMDILVLLLGFRLLRPHVHWRIVGAVDDAGRPLVDTVIKAVDHTLFRRSKYLSTDAAVWRCLMVLLVCRAILSLLST